MVLHVKVIFADTNLAPSVPLVPIIDCLKIMLV